MEHSHAHSGHGRALFQQQHRTKQRQLQQPGAFSIPTSPVAMLQKSDEGTQQLSSSIHLYLHLFLALYASKHKQQAAESFQSLYYDKSQGLKKGLTLARRISGERKES